MGEAGTLIGLGKQMFLGYFNPVIAETTAFDCACVPVFFLVGESDPMKWNAIFECTIGHHMLNLLTNLNDSHHKLQLVTLLCF